MGAVFAASPTRVELFVGSHRLLVEVADEPRERQVGLMNRPSLPQGEGMLFVFPDDGRWCMWMRNTPIPLSVAFVDAAGVIRNLADMRPYSDKTHCASGPVRYALEVNQGWFAERSLGAGATLRGLESVPIGR